MVEVLENIQQWFAEFLSYRIWATDFFKVSVKSLLQVLLLLASARYGFWLLNRIIMRSKAGEHYDEGRRYTILQISKYIIYTVVIVVALETVGVKVTALLAASTALFVGLGLGLQDAFKDLSSGVIILVERTLSVGDIIQLENQIGKVEAVGLRTTTVRTRDDILIIVPNSKLTNETVINLTHSEETTRFSLTVSVAFGSDTEKVAKILYDIAANHPQADDKEEPLVLLKDFGDSALIFELNFYTRDLFFVEKIKSDLRFAIDKEFFENQIIIPFPQRTVWKGPERVTQFGNGIVGAGEIMPDEDNERDNGAV
jgi:small-conductance mechanosensitive channel